MQTSNRPPPPSYSLEEGEVTQVERNDGRRQGDLPEAGTLIETALELVEGAQKVVEGRGRMV